MLRTMIPASLKPTPAFTRLELVACLGAIALFGAVILPTLATSASRGDRVVCFSNLRQIGVAYGHQTDDGNDLIGPATCAFADIRGHRCRRLGPSSLPASAIPVAR